MVTGKSNEHNVALRMVGKDQKRGESKMRRPIKKL